MESRHKRNLNPTAPAYVAMALFGKRYGAQRGGSMDFWDTLSQYEKRTCMQLAIQIREAPMQEGEHRKTA